MEIIVGKSAGFCGGVLNSVNKELKYLDDNKKMYCLGELVHNKQVVSNLENKGLEIIESLDKVPDNSKVIIRAHGIAKEIYDEALKRNIQLYDLTCPKVLRIHQLAKQYNKEGYFIILIAHKIHPEVLGTISYCGEDSAIIETEDDIDNVVNKVNNSSCKKVVVMAQTTYSVDKFNKIVEILKQKIKNDCEFLVNNTICNATDIRQKETKKLASLVDCMIIIGGKNSSNTKKLFDISEETCKKTYLVEDVNELEDDFSLYEKIGIMAGASTPNESIEEVVSYLKKGYFKKK